MNLGSAKQRPPWSAQLAGQRLIASVQLIKALGGGWEGQGFLANNRTISTGVNL